jgi:hypothetical protein
MNSKLFGLIAGMGILAGGVAVVTSLGGKDGKPIGDAVISTEQRIPTESEVVDRAVRASNNKLVHVVGVDAPKDSVVADTDVGRAVVVSEVKDTSECEVVLEAKEATVTIQDGRRNLTVTRIDLDPKVFTSGTFVKLGNFDKTKETYIWSALLTGQRCKEIALAPGYLGSTMKELLSLPEAMKARVLRTYGQCDVVDKDGKPAKETVIIDGKPTEKTKTYRCDVAYGDPRAINAEEIFFPHHFADRNDLKMMPAKGSEVQKRYATPDGGFREATAEPAKEIK